MTLPAAQAFHALSEDYLSAYFDFNPALASQLGLHAYDGRAADLGPASVRSRLAALRAFRARLSEIGPGQLDDADWFDYQVLQGQLEGEIFQWEEWRPHQSDATLYACALDVSNYVKRDYAPLPQRVQAMARYLSAYPEMLAVARQNLGVETIRPAAQIALDMVRGIVTFLKEELPALIGDLDDPVLLGEFALARDLACQEAADFAGWIERELLPRSTDVFAIGAESFLKLVRFTAGLDVGLDELLDLGERDLAQNKAAYLETAQHLAQAGSTTVEEVIRAQKRNHPLPADLVDETRAMLGELRSFIVEHDLVSIPYDDACRVEATPQFLRWAFAMMDTPGPFEEVAREAYFYVTPPEDGWSQDRVEEWMSAFNYPLLRNTALHEAWPGHFLQGLWERNAPSRVANAFGSYAFVEGWAHYCEQMMIEEGYHAQDGHYRLAQLSDALTRNVRYVCAVRIHTQGMTVDEAQRRFQDDAFMDPAPAREEAVRGTYDPGYFNYTLGKLMLLDLREEVRAVEGSRFALKRFHDRLLAYGSPPIPVLRTLILGRTSSTHHGL